MIVPSEKWCILSTELRRIEATIRIRHLISWMYSKPVCSGLDSLLRQYLKQNLRGSPLQDMETVKYINSFRIQTFPNSILDLLLFFIALSTTGLTIFYWLSFCPHSPLSRTQASRKQGLWALLLFRATSPVSSPALSMAVTHYMWSFRFNLKFINIKQN